MCADFDHTIVYSRDRRRSASLVGEILGFRVHSIGPVICVEFDNAASLEFVDAVEGPITIQHYSVAVDGVEFDRLLARIRQRQLDYWADPHRLRPHEVRRDTEGYRLYFTDPDGHVFEVFTERKRSMHNAGASALPLKPNRSSPD